MAWVDNQAQARLAWPAPSKLFTPVVTVILVLMVAGLAVMTYMGDAAVAALALNPGRVLRGAVWQLITYPFLNTPCALILGLLAVLFIGGAVEREWGSRKFALLWLVVSLTCGILWTMISLLAGREWIGLGASPCIYGTIAAFGMVYRRRRFMMLLGVVQAHHLALIFIGLGVVLGIAAPIGLIWVAGAVVAYAHITIQRRFTARRTKSAAAIRPSGFVDVD